MGSVAAAIGLSVLVAGAASAGCRPDVAEMRGAASVVRFSVEVADSGPERAQGLMNRPRMASSAGMLFVYDKPQRAGFWMKNTLIPLDMIFMDDRGVVTGVHENAVPQDRTLIDGGAGVKLVLEINGGLARRLGIGPGAVLRHPAVQQDGAVWACEG